MKRKTRKKIQLHKETLRNLEADHLLEAFGGRLGAYETPNTVLCCEEDAKGDGNAAVAFA